MRSSMNEKINYYVWNPLEKSLLVKGEITLVESDLPELSVQADPPCKDQVFRVRKEAPAAAGEVRCGYGLKLYFEDEPKSVSLTFDDGASALTETLSPQRTMDRRCADSVLYPWRREAKKRLDYLGSSVPGIARERLSAALSPGLKKWLREKKRFVLEHMPGYQSDYEKWIALNEDPDPAALMVREGDPLISILLPVYNVPAERLMETVESVMKQSYPNWELCLVDDASGDEELIRLLKELPGIDRRIRVRRHEENAHISRTTNDAAAMARGEYVAFLDHDDLLAPDALASVVLELRENPDLDILYSDEDKIDADGARFYPYFKPDYSPETLLSNNYMTHFLTMRKSLFDELSGLRPECDGAQDHDLVLRAAEKTGRIAHIPKILYHWRADEGSTALGADEKRYAREAGLFAVNDALERRGWPARARASAIPGSYAIDMDPGLPGPVTVIIPTKDNPEVLTRCVDSIFEKTPEDGFTVLLVNNNSEEEKTFRSFERLKRRYEGRLRVIDYPHPFNYSKINNFAAKRAEGEYLLFLNDDTEVISGCWMSSMARLAALPGIGAVGAKLLYPDGSIQHAGVVLGLGPSQIAGHFMTRMDADAEGYFGRLQLLCNYAAVTAACLMVKKERFFQAGAFTEELSVNYNDIDLCLKLLREGYRNVYDPEAVLCHYESLSRGSDFSYEKDSRMRQEKARMQQDWGPLLRHDPCYSPHLSLSHADGRIRVQKNEVAHGNI